MTGVVSVADFGSVDLLSFEPQKPTMKAGRFGRCSRTASFFMALDRLKIRLWMPSWSSFFFGGFGTLSRRAIPIWPTSGTGIAEATTLQKRLASGLGTGDQRRFRGLDLSLSAIVGTAEVLHYALQTGRANRSFPNYRIIPMASVQPKRPNASPCSKLPDSREKPSQY